MTYDDFERWAEATTHGRRLFNYRFRLFGHELKGWTRVKAVVMQETAHLTESVSLWQQEENGTAERVIRVGVDELDSWRAAHKRLQATLDHCMRPAIPAGTGELARIGDVRRVARAPRSQVPAAISFSRGNVCVFVNSVGDVHVDVSDVAVRVDALLSEPPTRGDLGRQLARATAPRTVVVKREGPQPLVRRLSKTVPRDAWLKVIAPDGELRRDGDQIVYVASQPGAKRIATFLITGARAPAAKRGRRR